MARATKHRARRRFAGGGFTLIELVTVTVIIAIIAGWFLRPADRDAGFMSLGGRALATGWLFVIRFITPVLVLLVILAKMGILGS